MQEADKTRGMLFDWQAEVKEQEQFCLKQLHFCFTYQKIFSLERTNAVQQQAQQLTTIWMLPE